MKKLTEGPPRISAKRKKKSKPVIPPKPERFLPYTVAQNGQIGRGGPATGIEINKNLRKSSICRSNVMDFYSKYFRKDISDIKT